MLEKAISRLLSLGEEKLRTFTIDGRNYSNVGLVKIPKPFIRESLLIRTLSGLVDYLNKNIDSLEKSKLVVHVEGPTSVSVSGFFMADDFCQRPEYLRAEFEKPSFNYGGFYDIEDFIIAMQTKFVKTSTVDNILKMVGNIKDELVKNVNDDGVSQAVTVKAGIERVEGAIVPNPVTLQPFRTFPEVDQPESLFILRMRQNHGSLPSCALFEADNALWKVTAIKNIAAFLSEKITDVPIIA